VDLFSKRVGESYLPRDLRDMHNKETSPKTNSNPGDFSFPSIALAAIVLVLSFVLLAVDVATGSVASVLFSSFSPVITKEE
jgi:hypothetical protein